MWYRLDAGKVVEIFAQQPVLHPSLMRSVLDLPDGGQLGDQWDGSQFITPAPKSKLEGGEREPTAAELTGAGAEGLAYLERELDAFIDAECRSRGYKTRDAIAVTAITTAPAAQGGRFKDEALALINWRNNCYAIGEDVRDAVLAGQRTVPTWSELRALMPAVPNRRR